ncbi:MAG TPA: alpha-amylase [Gammaproteobacteria bacterium]|nr:alpha-amylase [Gammaproteobacteria bacterium]|tara:strand:- start:5247 stop:7019 length:1773 start_codon:yes stop_codon:yes gene_type:complete
MQEQTQASEHDLLRRVREHLTVLYPDEDLDVLSEYLVTAMSTGRCVQRSIPNTSHWDQSDCVVISYGNTIKKRNELPLVTLRRFLNTHLKDSISTVHILPFFPFSSDDGFSVIDYLEVNPAIGGWSEIEDIASDFKLMSDLVINHVSRQSRWFENFKRGLEPGKGYFFEVDLEEDYSAVVRPRNSPLFSSVETVDGERHVWCTFSNDQMDLNFRNPEVLKEFVQIVRNYLDHGVSIFRMDAVPFLWKEPGTSCIHLQQTHEIIKLFRTLIEYHSSEALIICENNVPNRENLTYFGNANEAHIIYNFSLPPLLAYTLLAADCRHLKTWMMSMPPAQFGTTYLNFIASHDGIGLRPLDGLLSNEERDKLVRRTKTAGGKVTYRRAREGYDKPYELNIALFDLLQGTFDGSGKDFGYERYICAHTIMLALEGIPAIYIQSFLGTRNDLARVERTGYNRSINRQIWQEEDLENELKDSRSPHARIFQEVTRLLAIRKKQHAFHPNATQYTLHLGHEIFAFWRQSINRDQSIFCVSNVTDEEKSICLADINLISIDVWQDLISGEYYPDIGEYLKLRPYQTVWISNKSREETSPI